MFLIHLIYIYIYIYRVESFIEHQDACNLGRLRSESQVLQPAACLSRTASSPSPSSDTNFSTAAVPNWPAALVMPKPSATNPFFRSNSSKNHHHPQQRYHHNLDLQLSTTTTSNPIEIISVSSPKRDENHSTQLQLSIGSSDFGEKNESNVTNRNSPRDQLSSSTTNEKPPGAAAASRLKEEAREQLRLAMVEKSFAEEARQQAKIQIELAEKEFANAKRMRQQAQAELDRAQSLKEHAIKQINSTILQVTCHACKQQFQARSFSCISSSAAAIITSEGEMLENIDHIRRDHHLGKSSNP
ncbi:hypothetical protein FEM48_Zijuj05G0169900 [Ziziphus jujuba var. spinosa]|uniref:Protein SHOOT GRAVITROPISM 5-like n=1 Tax=Ziziphus jujuba var. spinosa TaxID=714518 RepID=A0A978VG11_ZIZJJ|nr:hypothetical protein FEM48_Zijuj05G0169900 [Ziziphus jujuba var. spinosa]